MGGWGKVGSKSLRFACLSRSLLFLGSHLSSGERFCSLCSYRLSASLLFGLFLLSSFPESLLYSTVHRLTDLSVSHFLPIVGVVKADETWRVHFPMPIAWKACTWGTVVFSWCILESISNRCGWGPRTVVIAANAVFAESLRCGARE